MKSQTTVPEELARGASAMLRFALAQGRAVPTAVVAAVSEAEAALSRDDGEPPAPATLHRLAGAYEKLARIVAPATPRGLMLLAEQRRGGIAGFLGPVRLVRYMMVAALLSLALFIGVGLSPEINMMSERSDLFELSGRQLVLAELFRLSAAGLGAAFAALFQANRFIAEGSFDPRYEPSYWVRFALGLIAGLVLAELVPLESEGSAVLGKPLLALLGGFSAVLVYRVLDRLVTTVDSLIRGDARDIAAARDQAAAARLTEEQARLRIESAARLLELQRQLTAGAPSDALSARLAELVDEVLNETVPGETVPAASSLGAVPRDGSRSAEGPPAGAAAA